MLRNSEPIVQRFKNEFAVYRCVWQDERTPKRAKWLLGLAIAYTLTPIDLIPDFIPVVGHLDDILIVPALIWLAMRFIPRDVLSQCRERVLKAQRIADGDVHD